MLLSASPGEVVDQIEKVECHQEEGKHEKQSEYHARGSDNNIHDAGLVLGLKSNDCRIERANDSRILLMNFQIYAVPLCMLHVEKSSKNCLRPLPKQTLLLF